MPVDRSVWVVVRRGLREDVNTYKHAVLDIPYVTFGKMCSDIDKWLNSSIPKLDIENYLYRKA